MFHGHLIQIPKTRCTEHIHYKASRPRPRPKPDFFEAKATICCPRAVLEVEDSPRGAHPCCELDGALHSVKSARRFYFWWVQTSVQFFAVSPKRYRIKWSYAKVILVCNAVFRLSISCCVPGIFAIESKVVRNLAFLLHV